jgi:hypothetical protein
MLLYEYEIEFMFRKIRNIRNLGNVHIRGPHIVTDIVMSRSNAQNGLDFHFNVYFQSRVATLNYPEKVDCIDHHDLYSILPCFFPFPNFCLTFFLSRNKFYYQLYHIYC